MRRVVVTGLGLVTPLGADVETSWKNILARRAGRAAQVRRPRPEMHDRGEVKPADHEYGFDPPSASIQIHGRSIPFTSTPGAAGRH